MLDELDALFEEQGPEPSAEASIPVSPTKALITILRGGTVPDFAAATPEERAELVYELEQVRAIKAAATDRARAIELAIGRAAAALAANELRTADGMVRIKPSDPGYDTEDAKLHAALTTCVGMGDLTKAELDAAMPTLIIYKPDHRKLNGLLKRGARVKEAIETHRRKPAPDLLHGKVEIHRQGGVS
jgi:hypothetical protein